MIRLCKQILNGKIGDGIFNLIIGFTAWTLIVAAAGCQPWPNATNRPGQTVLTGNAKTDSLIIRAHTAQALTGWLGFSIFALGCSVAAVVWFGTTKATLAGIAASVTGLICCALLLTYLPYAGWIGAVCGVAAIGLAVYEFNIYRQSKGKPNA